MGILRLASFWQLYKEQKRGLPAALALLSGVRGTPVPGALSVAGHGGTSVGDSCSVWGVVFIFVFNVDAEVAHAGFFLSDVPVIE